MTDQPLFVAEYVEKRSRLTTFFRLLLAIPHFIVLWLWGMFAFVAVVIAWFALVITGRFPQGLYGFVASFMRYSTSAVGYTALLTDEYPPFSGDTAQYPVRLELPPPQARYSRLKAFFRWLLAIPVLIIIYAMQIVYQLGAFITWFAIVIIGRQPKGLQDMIVLGYSYQQRAYAYLFLLTERFPSFLDPGSTLGPGPSATSLPPAPATAAPPAAPEAPRGSGLSGGDPLR